MSQGTMSMAVEGADDLPRTLRRAREERMREVEAEQAALQQPQLQMNPTQPAAVYAPRADEIRGFGVAAEAVTVEAIRVPFFKLVAFFIKAVFAAIPAILLLGFVLWLVGKGLQSFFPDTILIQTTIYPKAK